MIFARNFSLRTIEFSTLRISYSCSQSMREAYVSIFKKVWFEKKGNVCGDDAVWVIGPLSIVQVTISLTYIVPYYELWVGPKYPAPTSGSHATSAREDTWRKSRCLHTYKKCSNINDTQCTIDVHLDVSSIFVALFKLYSLHCAIICLLTEWNKADIYLIYFSINRLRNFKFK